MPARSFRVTSPSPTPIGRLPDGKFTRGDTASPPEIVRRSREQGADAARVLAENRAAEHPRPAGAPPTAPGEVLWPELGPSFNEAGKAPFRVVG